MSYPGDYYAAIGDFLREKYLDYGFARGTIPEVDFLVELLDLPAGAKILDVGCGPGRHSLELARRGYQMVGVDISSGFIEVAQTAAAREHLNATFRVGDARSLNLPPEFDAAICLCEGAFSVAGSEEGHRQTLRGIHAALKPGALFVLTTLNAFHIVRRLSPDASFDVASATLAERETITNPAGETRDVEFYTSTFTARELRWLLAASDFTTLAAYGCSAGAYRREPLTLEHMEIMMVARKN